MKRRPPAASRPTRKCSAKSAPRPRSYRWERRSCARGRRFAAVFREMLPMAGEAAPSDTLPEMEYKRQQVTETQIHARRDCCCEKCFFCFLLSAICLLHLPDFLYAIHRYGSMILQPSIQTNVFSLNLHALFSGCMTTKNHRKPVSAPAPPGSCGLFCKPSLVAPGLTMDFAHL